MKKHPFIQMKNKFKAAALAERVSTLVVGAVPPGLPASTNNSVFMCAIRDQGQEGSCTANAACDLRDYWQKKQGLNTVVPTSAQAFYYWEESSDGTQGTDSGANDGDYEDASWGYGFCPETEDKYWSGNDTDAVGNSIINLTTKPSAQLITDAFPYRTQLAAANMIDTQCYCYNPHGYSLSDCMAMQLALGSPMWTAFIVPTSIMNPVKNSAGDYVVDATQYSDLILENGSLCGHTVVVIDYKADPDRPGKKLFRFQNSWGVGTRPGQSIPWPSSTDSTGCAWFTEEFLNMSFMDPVHNQQTNAVENAITMMGNPGCTYYAQVGPYSAGYLAAAAANALAAKGYPVNPTLQQPQLNTSVWFVNVGPYSTIQLGMIAAGDISILTSPSYPVAPTLFAVLDQQQLAPNPTYQ